MAKSFAIIGLGSFGYWVAKTLNEYGHETVVIDTNRELVQSLKPYATHAIIGDAISMETLASLGLDQMDAVIVSLGDNISASCLVTLHLLELGARNIYVKAINEDHAKILKKVGATHVIYPEKDMAVKTARELITPNVMEFITLTEDYEIVEFAPPPGYIGQSLASLQLPTKYDVQVIAVKELVPERFTVIPKADFVIKDSDILIILGNKNDIRRMKDI